MGKELVKLHRRKEVQRKLDDVSRRRDDYLIIHYSCESFYEIKDGRTPRITSIAIRNFSTGQTNSFSIHKCAEQSGGLGQDIKNNYDRLEREMLDEYFDFVKSRHGYNFIHWNMRDINFGFQALEHRYKVLGGNPVAIEDNRKFDLAKDLVALFGPRYAGHGDHGRLFSLMALNKISAQDALNGKEEADAFENGDYVRLHQSTLRKVDVMSNILERVLDGSIETNSSWWDVHGMHPAVIVELVRKHWLWSLGFGILAIVRAVYYFKHF